MKTALTRTPLKRRPVSPLKRAKKKADTAFSLYIRARDQVCTIAGLDNIHCSDVLQCMHLITRGIPALRYDEVNAIGGCSGHHIYYTNNPADWENLLKERFTLRWEYIQEHRNDPSPHRKQADYEELERFFTHLREKDY